MQLTSVKGYLNNMASLLPLIQDILPMILPTSIAVKKAADILPPQTPPNGADGETRRVQVISRNAIVDETDRMCASGKQDNSFLYISYGFCPA